MTKLVTVPFRGDTLFAIQDDDGVSVAIKPITDRLGLDWSAQLKRTKRDPILSKGMAIMTIPSPGGAQEATCLRLKLLPGWLFGIGANQVREEARPLVMLYQEECHEVLFRHFNAPPRGEGECMTHPPFPSAAREEPVRVRRQLVTEARHVFGERAAGRLWFALGLPIVPEMHSPPAQADFGFTYTAIPTPPRPPGSGPA